MSANGTLANGTLAKRLVGKTTTTHMLTMVFRWGGGPVKKIGKLVFSLSGLRLDSLFQLLCIRKILRHELKLLSVITILPLTWWTSYFQEEFWIRLSAALYQNNARI